jgi:tyrosine-protein kinase
VDLSVYYKPLLRYWWLLVAATVVAGVSTYITVSRQAVNYQARTTLMIGQLIENPNPSSGEFYLAEQLATAYAAIARRKPVQDATKTALGLDSLPQYITRAVPQTQFIEILVTDINPLRAQMVANELANQLIQRSPSGELAVDQEHQAFINQQIDDLQSQITNTREEIARLQVKLGDLNSASEIQNTQGEIAAQQQKLITLQSTYASLLANTQQGATNTLLVVEPAELPTTPIGPDKKLVTLIAAGIGFFLAAGAAYLLDYLDDTLKTPEDVKRVLGFPVIGFFPETKETDEGKNGLYVLHYPSSPTAEAYRSLRANLQLMSDEQPFQSILITSTSISVGKTSIAANLALVMAQGDKSVILMDADLHKPKVHKILNVSNKFGLTDILLNGLGVEKALASFKNENFKVIPSGRFVDNPSVLLASAKFDQLFTNLKEITDYIIVDSPPMVVADTLYLAAKVDGVLIVIRPGHVRRKAALNMVEQFERAGARVLGVVFNRIPLTGIDSYSGYDYYHSYYSSYNSNEDQSQAEHPANLPERLKMIYKKTRVGINSIRNGKADR